MATNPTHSRGASSARPGGPRGPALSPRVLLTKTFYLPFLVAACLVFWLADKAPGRFESRMVVAIPRPTEAAEDEPESRVSRRRELDSLRLLFRSPSRIEASLGSLRNERELSGENALPRLAARLARQTSVTILDDAVPGRTVVEVRTWATDRTIPAMVLRAMGEDLLVRYERVSGSLPGRAAQVRARRDAQAAAVEHAHDDLRDLVEEILPEGSDLEEASSLEDLSEEGWLRSLLRKEAEAAGADADASRGTDREALAAKLADVPDARHRFRTLRRKLEQEKDLLEEIERQETAVKSRREAVPESALPLNVIEWPDTLPERAPSSRVSLLLVSASIGGIAGSLALFLRLLGRDVRSRRRRVPPSERAEAPTASE